MPATVIAVFGSSLCQPVSPEYQDAYQLGAEIARAGWTLCNGGYGGIMEASAKGAVESGGHTIGVTCAVFGRPGPNAFIRQEIPTFDLHTRLDILMRLASGYVVLPGGSGTLVELALAVELIAKGLLDRSAPVVLLGRHWQPVVDVLRAEQPGHLPVVTASEVADVIEALRRGLSAPGTRYRVGSR